MQLDRAVKVMNPNSLPAGNVYTLGLGPIRTTLLSVVCVVPVLALQPNDTPSFVLKYSESMHPYACPL